ncbi:MAG: DHHW family protein [Eubacteriales bacterium]|nr:DHHW family protein [Eubacteriales bacterium]
MGKTRTPYARQSLRYRKIWRTRALLIFIVLFLFFFLLGLCIWWRPTESVSEKRKLAAFPKLSVVGLINGQYFTDLTTWYSDTYPIREPMIGLNSFFQRFSGIRTGGQIYGSASAAGGEAVPDPIASSNAEPAPVLTFSAVAQPTEEEEVLEDGTIHNKPEVAGTIYVTDNQGFELYYFNQDNADAYAAMLNTVAQWTGSAVDVYDMVIPTSFGICLDKSVQESLGASAQEDAIPYIYSRMSSDVKTISVFDTLKKHNSDYLYFRTDHHWTALGAYYSYKEFCKVKGITPHELADYEMMEFPGFLGSYYAYSNQSAELAAKPDTVYAYKPIATNDLTYVSAEDGETYESYVITDANDYSEENKYLCFICGDQPYEEIHNPSLPDGESCIVIKESFGNALVPFLVDHYKDIYVIDYRYYTGDLTQMCIDKNIKDVIFLNNTEAIDYDRAQTMLGMFSDHSSDPVLNGAARPTAAATATPTPTPETTADSSASPEESQESYETWDEIESDNTETTDDTEY